MSEAAEQLGAANPLAGKAILLSPGNVFALAKWLIKAGWDARDQLCRENYYCVKCTRKSPHEHAVGADMLNTIAGAHGAALIETLREMGAIHDGSTKVAARNGGRVPLIVSPAGETLID